MRPPPVELDGMGGMLNVWMFMRYRRQEKDRLKDIDSVKFSDVL